MDGDAADDVSCTTRSTLLLSSDYEPLLSFVLGDAQFSSLVGSGARNNNQHRDTERDALSSQSADTTLPVMAGAQQADKGWDSQQLLGCTKTGP